MRCAMFRDGVARLLVFRVGYEHFAIPLSAVAEVADAQAIQRLPDAPPSVLGVASVRGMLVTVYDPRVLLAIEGKADGMILLFDRGDRREGLAIDDVFDSITIESGELLPAPGSAASDRVLAGMIRRDSQLITVLDRDALLEAATEMREGERT